jgi:TolB protein
MRVRYFLLAALMAASPAVAQTGGAPPAGLPVIAVPPLPTPKVEQTAAGQTHAIGLQVAEVIASDLRASGVVAPIGPANLRVYSYPEVTGPQFQQWRSTGAKALVTGFVQASGDDQLTVGCYLFDINERREVARKGFRVPVREWRRAAHRCADVIYTGLTKRSGIFDTRIVYVAESGQRTARQKRLAIMDADGSNHNFLTSGSATVVDPSISPDGDYVAYTSFEGRTPHVRIAETTGGADRPLLTGLPPRLSFSPVFSPDGQRILFSMAVDGNTDLYVVNAGGGAPQRLTSTPGSDTSGSFSPDGSQIVFASDRSGTPQLYVMNADGSGQRRISFGPGRYGAPAWSPSGDLIAFSRGGIGVMTSAGRDERMLTSNSLDEGPSWGPSGLDLVFHRSDPARGRTSLMFVSVSGGEPRERLTPQDGSDADWSKVQE